MNHRNAAAETETETPDSIAGSNYAAAVDQTDAYGSLNAALAAHLTNAIDTAREYDVDVASTVRSFFGLLVAASAAMLATGRRGRYVVRDDSQYARPDGGRLSSWIVFDRRRGVRVSREDTRKDARDEARRLNDAQLARDAGVDARTVLEDVLAANSDRRALSIAATVRAAVDGGELPPADAPIAVVHAWMVHGADVNGEGGEGCPDGCSELGDPARVAAYQRPAAIELDPADRKLLRWIVEDESASWPSSIDEPGLDAAAERLEALGLVVPVEGGGIASTGLGRSVVGGGR